MLGSTHKPAAIPSGATIEVLRRQDEKANRLVPESLVTVINRGREPLVRKWDAEDYELKPFTHHGGTVERPYLMQMPYAAALHFQHHCPIPGTRDPNSNTLAASSFLGILDTDTSLMCTPLSDEDCATAGQAIEAIERTGEEPVKVIEMVQVNKTKVGQGGLGNQTSRAPEFTKDVAREHMQPPDGVSSEIRSEIAEGEAAEAEEAGVAAAGKGRRRR